MMTEKLQAMPDNKFKRNEYPDRGDPSGRTGSGESGGGAYKDKNQVKGNPEKEHGGQSNIEYHGSGDAADGNTNPNAPTKSD